VKLADSKLARHPQGLWVRRALFQVHLWTGLAFALYVFLISLSGSAIVFRREMDHAFCPQIIMVKPSGPRMSDTQLAVAARSAAPERLADFTVHIEVRGPRVPGAAVEVWYVFPRGRFERLFDPYTGKDLGDAVACEPVYVTRLAQLHDDLLSGAAGRTVNGVGAMLLVLVCLTGAVIWWPGTSRWRRSMTLRWNVHWRRFTWDLHSVLGFWMFALLLMWGVSGIYFGFPNSFYAAGDFLIAHSGGLATSDRFDAFIDWLVTLHFGRAFGLWIKVLWLVLGLVPVALLATGALMWWNRVLRKVMGRSGEELQATGTAHAATPPPVRTTDTAAG
jgi:uncharacterized iron-regulated membrane protein